MGKRQYFRRCGACGERFEQSEMIRTDNSSNGWLCEDCYKEYDDIEYDVEEF